MNVVGPPVTTVSATLRVPLVAPTIWNQLPVTFTGSLNVIVTSVLEATPVAPSAGVVALTARRRFRRELEDEIRRHVVGRIVRVLVVHLRCEDRRPYKSRPAAKSALGLIVNVVGPPSRPCPQTFRVPLVVQTIWNQLPVTLTGSLKVTVTSVLVSWLAAPLAGVVAVTLGAASCVSKLKTKSAAMLSGGSFAS